MGQREAIERYHGKEFTDKEWDLIRPDSDETPDDVEKGLPRRLEEKIERWDLEWELPTRQKMEQAAVAVAEDRALLATVSYQVGSDPWPWPQLPDLAAAHAYLKQNSLDFERIHVGMGEAERTGRPYKPDLDWTSVEKIYLPPCGEETDGWVVKKAVLDVVHPVLPGDVEYHVTDPVLKHLAAASRRAAELSGCWSLGQAAAFLLTRQAPKLPRVRLWTSRLPGGAVRSLIEVYGALNFDEMKALHAIMRRNADAYRRRDSSVRDLELVQFVESFGPSQHRSRKAVAWKTRLRKWNELHPERMLGSTSALINAFKQARDRAGTAAVQ